MTVAILEHAETFSQEREKLINREQHTHLSHSEQEAKAEPSALLPFIAQGDRKAFEEFYHHYSTMVFHFVKKRSYDTSIIEEVVQDIFVNVWKKAAYFRDERGTVDQWLFTIARNRLYDYWRKIERFCEDANIEHTSMKAPDEFISDSTFVVEKALTHIPHEYRTIIHLIYIKGHTTKECSQILSQPEGTIKWKVKKALEQMKSYLLKNDNGVGK